MTDDESSGRALDEHLTSLPGSARDAISAAQARVARAVAADDVEATIGGAKELIETVSKSVLDALGVAYGSSPSAEGLARQTLQALDLDPATQAHRPRQRLGSSLIAVAQAMGEIRNTDGTGHGRARRSDLHTVDALLARDAAEAWSSWVLATASRILGTRAGLDQAILDIGGDRVFSQGSLAAYLDALGLQGLHEADQRKIGLAVARRWTVNGTFMPLRDVVEPIENGDVDYPAAFCEGIVEGLMLDHNGYVHTSALDLQHAVGVGARLPAQRRRALFDGLADRIAEAGASSGLDTGGLREVIDGVRTMAEERSNAAIRPQLRRIAERLSELNASSDR